MREVSTQATRMLLEASSRAGLDGDKLTLGLSRSHAELRAPRGRVDWDTFAMLCNRVEEASYGKSSLEDLGAAMLVVPSFDFLRRAGRLVVTPRQLYVLGSAFIAPALFNNLIVEQRWLPTGRLLLRTELPLGYRESAAFFRLTHGNAAALPRLLDLPASFIEEQVVTGRCGRLILVPPPSHTIAARVVRGARVAWGLRDVVRGIERQRTEVEASLAALQSSRHELRQLIERLPEGVLVHKEGRVRWANCAMLSILGYENVEAVADKLITDFIPEEDRAALVSQMARAAKNDVSDSRLEYRVARPDGARRRVQAGTTQHVEFEGEPCRLVVLRDVTENHQLKEQLALADRMAAIGTIAAGVAHEINNPLAYVHMNLELASRETAALGEPARTARLEGSLAVAREGTVRMRDIVKNLKVLSRAHEEPLVPVDLPRLLDSMLRLATSAIAPKALVVRSYGPVPPALATEGPLGQVFLNLLLNAADAIPEGAPLRHEVRVTTMTDAARRAVVEISDTGTGIPHEVAARVFDPFFTTKPVGKGTGLGLSICHRIVGELGGEISFRSSEADGTTFRIVLPPARAMAVAKEAAHVPSHPRGRVLVVDDEPMLLRAVCMTLREAHDVVSAEGGLEALDLLKADQGFDVVLADLMMARVTGMDLYEAVRLAHPGFEKRILFMTGGAFTAHGREFLARVPNRCIEKPFAREALLRAVGEIVSA